MSKKTTTPTVTAKIAREAVKLADEHVSGADAEHKSRVAFVVASEAARLGAMGGNILADTIATLIVATRWDIGWTAAKAAYTENGGADGTFRVATTRANLLTSPKKSQPGHNAFVRDMNAAILLDTVSDQIVAVRKAMEAYKGDTSYNAFFKALADKNDPAKPERSQRTSDNMVAEAIKAANAGDDPDHAGKVREDMQRADNAMSADGSGDICARIASFFEHCSEDQALRVVRSLSAVGLYKVETAVCIRAGGGAVSKEALTGKPAAKAA